MTPSWPNAARVFRRPRWALRLALARADIDQPIVGIDPGGFRHRSTPLGHRSGGFRHRSTPRGHRAAGHHASVGRARVSHGALSSGSDRSLSSAEASTDVRGGRPPLVRTGARDAHRRDAGEENPGVPWRSESAARRGVRSPRGKPANPPECDRLPGFAIISTAASRLRGRRGSCCVECGGADGVDHGPEVAARRAA